MLSSARNKDFKLGEPVRERKSLEEKSTEVVGVVLSERREEVVPRLFRCPVMDSTRVGGAIEEDKRTLRGIQKIVY